MSSLPKVSVSLLILVTTSATAQVGSPSALEKTPQPSRDSLDSVRRNDSATALKKQENPENFIWDQRTNRQRKAVPWPYLREADVFIAKRITRIIDMREKQNQCMLWPGNPINKILYNAIINGDLTAYRNDSLISVMTIEEFIGRGSDTDFVDRPLSPDDPEVTEADTVVTIFDPLKIKKLRVLEDWIFDKKLSTMYVRIIAIGLVYNPKVAGYELGEQDLCVLRYQKTPLSTDRNGVRDLLVNKEIFNRQNQIRITYDDWFEQRLFSSYIIKESNPYDFAIKEFGEFKDDKVGALLESENIRYKLFEMEHDLWEY